ncbi:acyltransferase domain-containing protein [Desulfovibrio sp. OH1186_COT-070]|nr:acyltransferase domain-containing protein [Desulfovibrio sp. OH1209_COT-279]RRD87692.1 acyltransferase domain-containing protein [Desulfovibrio sp. OH1186_COT-070]
MQHVTESLANASRPNELAPEGFVPGGQAPDEFALDGVVYAEPQQAGRLWRLAATNPRWREEVLSLPADPDEESLDALRERGLWLAPDAPPPPLAVMCCGLGSVWPGMGRELYDNFPVARAAMDRIAAVADWDVLGLMDERDAEKISMTRWQIPYLFLLELAQWSVFSSLGLRPSLFCGHSLGELIALCFAGVYAPEVAWYILDTRAEHMAELEAAATRETGMMAVHGDGEILREVLAAWPTLSVSNYNTPRQFILGGPRNALQEARKSLRSRRIPAIVLNVSLAFHHPGMRVLRDLSLRRLNALDMSPPARAMLSCVTTGPYPEDQPSVCRYIADLDENPVRWTECVQAMWNRDGIRHFLELGPQDTLCGLVRDNEARALCLSAGGKGREAEALRQACAWLYSRGHLRRAAVAARWREARTEGDGVAPAPRMGLRPLKAGEGRAAPDPEPDAPTGAVACAPPEAVPVALDILARACGKQAADLRPEMDLRHDLALRSSRFPLIVQEVEKALGISLDFEDLLRVSTVGDLLRLASGQGLLRGGEGAGPPPLLRRTGPQTPLCRFSPASLWPDKAPAPGEGAGWSALPPLLPLDPCGQGLPLKSGDVLLCVLDDGLLPSLLSGLAPLGCVLAVPRDQQDVCAPLARAGARLEILDFSARDMRAGEVGAEAALRALAASCGRPDGLLLAPPCDTAKAAACRGLLEGMLLAACDLGLRYACFCSLFSPQSRRSEKDFALERSLLALALERAVPARSILLQDHADRAGAEEWGDMLARELTHGTENRVLWARPEDFFSEAAEGVLPPVPHALRLAENSAHFPLVFPDPAPAYQGTATLFQGACHFSRYADPALSAHGKENGVPCLPVCRALEALQEGARQFLPWLTVAGFSDVRFLAPPSLPAGITRECRLTLDAQPWLAQDGVMARMCRGALFVRDLRPNGRHADGWSPVTHGMVLLAAERGALPPLWPDTAAFPDCGAPGGRPDWLTAVYEAWGLGEDWRLLEDFSAMPGGMFAATVRTPELSLASGGDCGYSHQGLSDVEGVIQAARLAVAHSGSDAFAHAEEAVGRFVRWRLSAAGFLRFGPSRAAGFWRLLVRRSWHSDRLLRFDAQGIDSQGNVFLTLHHLEFDGPSPEEAAY